MKFGGTSVQDGSALRRVLDIVRAHREKKPIVVVSAIAGATDSLLGIGKKAAAGEIRQAEEKVGDEVFI